MKDENKNQPAFPTGSSDRGIEKGLTKREYFAGLAMQGFLAANDRTSPDNHYKRKTAIHAVQMADALLKELT